MDYECAVRAIENAPGFTEPSSGVGEAWEFVLDTIERLTVERDKAMAENANLKERIAVLAGEAVRVAANEPEPKHHKFRLVKTKKSTDADQQQS